MPLLQLWLDGVVERMTAPEHPKIPKKPWDTLLKKVNKLLAGLEGRKTWVLF
jgi:hypothetical protein